MDRRNGGCYHQSAVPPRPPKSIPRVHRPRAPDPDSVDSSSPSIHIISTHPSPPPPIPSQACQAISRMNSNLINNNTINNNNNNNNTSNSSINSSSATDSTTATIHRSISSLPPPVTAPLTPLQNNRNCSSNSINNNNLISSSTSAISTFSRRRTEMTTPEQQQQQQQQQQQRVPASSINSVARSLTPSSLVMPTTNLISNAISAVVNRRSPSPVNNSVTLQIPRPENERLPNEYVDTPFANQNNNKLTTPGSRHSLATTVPTSRLNGNHNNNNNNINNNHQTIATATTNISIIDGTSVLNNNNNNINLNNKVNLPNRTIQQRPNLLPITKQPSFRNTNTFKKDASMLLHQQFSHCPEDNIFNSQNATNNNGLIINSNSDQLNSIKCPQCNRCRCVECQRPRQLPYKWICNENFLCSAETIIDYASCLCCVKGLYYHCAKEHENDIDIDTIRCAEDPCSCAPYKRISRWGCLSALSLLLPCLLCYWPMRGCVGLCAKCYAKHSRHGCRCNNNTSTANNIFNDRLNIINLASTPDQDQMPPHHYHRRSNNNDLTPEKRLLDSSSNEY